jgi:hypothetical protein
MLITEDWIDFLSQILTSGIIKLGDYRLNSIFIFHGLNAFCGLTSQTISNRLTQFYSSQYISASVIPSQIFESQANASVSQFISSTANDFSFSLSTIRDTTQSNALFSGMVSNYGFYTPGGHGYTSTYVIWYGNCSCALSAECIDQSSVLEYPSGKVLFSVPGIYTGCYNIESLLQSDLRCFYNQSCINKILSYYTTVPSMNIAALNKTLLVHFLENSTIQEVVDELMVEQ